MTNLIDPKDFLRRVLPDARGVPHPVANVYIMEAVRDFCEMTNIWRETVTQVMDTQTATIDTPYDADVVKILRVEVDGMELTPEREQNIPLSGVSEAAPRVFYQNAPGQISLSPFNECTAVMRLSLKPSDGIPDFIKTDWEDAIAAGALAYLLLLPDTTFANPVKANIKQNMFMEAVAKANLKTIQGQQRARLRTHATWL